MGEAKRRKQLGLMPTVHSFEAQMDADGNVTLTHGPEEPALRERIEAALEASQPSGAGWDSAYRTSYVMAGRSERRLQTVEDVQAIPVPLYRRFTGELVLGRAGNADLNIPAGEGGSLRLREQLHSFDGSRWEGFSTNRDPQEVLRDLLSHPAARLRGEELGAFRVEHWQEGRMDIEPEPPEEWLDPIEAVAREWHGETPEEWAQTHRDLLEEGDDGPVPVARRLLLELRRPAPLQSPLNPAFAIVGDVEFYPDPDGSSYTLDGETWLPYGDPDAAPEGGDGGDLGALLSQMLDVQTVPVTVWADGRVEWEEGSVPDEHAQRLRSELLAATGAGDPQEWAEWTRALLAETFADEAPYLAEVPNLPAVQAVRLDIPTDALTDPDDPAQYFMESEFTLDGEHWHDLYGEEVPEELERLRPSN